MAKNQKSNQFTKKQKKQRQSKIFLLYKFNWNARTNRRMIMASGLYHLLWGVVLYSCFMFLLALVASLMRFAAPLAPSQTYALMSIGEIVSLAPFSWVRNYHLNLCQNSEIPRLYISLSSYIQGIPRQPGQKKTTYFLLWRWKKWSR